MMARTPTMLKTAATTVALAAIAVGSAASATADEAEFLKVRDSYPTFSAEQLLAEGYRVCAVARQGVPSPVAVNMVTNDIGVSTTAALTIVSAAILNLDC